jgi:hypothetical protein
MTGRVLDSGTPEPRPGRRRCRAEPISALRPLVRCMPQTRAQILPNWNATSYEQITRQTSHHQAEMRELFTTGRLSTVSGVTSCDSAMQRFTSRDTLCCHNAISRGT